MGFVVALRRQSEYRGADWRDDGADESWTLVPKGELSISMGQSGTFIDARNTQLSHLTTQHGRSDPRGQGRILSL